MQNWTLVTGAARGLGAEICLTLAKAGQPLVIHYNLSQREAEDVAGRCRAWGVEAETLQGDFSTIEGVKLFAERYLAQFPHTKALVNNVGPFLIKSALDTSSTELSTLLQTNVQAPFALIKSLSESLKKQQGAIVNIGVAGLYHADTFCSGYSAAKASLYSLTKALARELAPFDVSVNMVSPGYLENSVTLPEEFPMKRPATLAEVASLVAYLLENRYITGQNIEIAGGVRL